MDDDPSSQGLRGRDLVGVGGILAGSVIVGLVLGLLADAHWGTSPAGVLIGIALGIVAGAIGFWVRVRAALRQ